MPIAAERITLSEQEYQENKKTAEFKHEYLKGKIWAMADASDNYVTITGNLFVLLKQQLKGTPCRSYISDMKVKVELANAFFILMYLLAVINVTKNKIIMAIKNALFL